MDMIHAMYNVNIKGELPNYSTLDKTIKNNIKPKRNEYLIYWWINNKINNDKFLDKNLYFYEEKLISLSGSY